ncbi:penicillin-binding protein activator [Halovulum marinum]|nr:penicillin-binding protein activator [Halovulum marinum]
MSFAGFLRSTLVLGALALAGCAAPVAGPGAGGGAVDPEQPVRVALLVPLGSTDSQREALGQSLVNAAQMARADLQNVDLELSVYATAGEAAAAENAARTALEEGADVVLGPLFSAATAQVAPLAAAQGLTVLSLSNTPDVAGGNVYILGNTFESTARRVVGHAAANGLLDLAVVYPQGPEGQLARNAVAQAAQAAGARLVAEASYPLSVQGITDATPAIAQRLRASAANAVVLTDGPTGGLSFVAETLRGLGVRPAAARFVGLQRWDTSAQAMAQPGLAGGWFAAPDQALSAQFESRYEQRFGQPPHPLSGLAYDGIAAIGALVAEARAEGRSDAFAPARLAQPSGFAGVMGIFRFLPNGRNERALAVYEVVDGVAQQISPAPRSFAASGS